MTYNQFMQIAEEHVKRNLADGIRVSVYETKKTNGVLRRGLRFVQKDINVSPTIYLEEYYEQFCSGKALEQIIKDILEMYENVKLQHSWDAEAICDYEQIQNRIVFRVIGERKNADLLKEIPHRIYLDLAVVYYVLLEINEWATATMSICKEHLEMWNVTEEQIHRQAMDNTPVLLTEEIHAMSEFLDEVDEKGKKELEDKIYVLTNRLRSYGAAVLFYPGCLKRVGAYLRESFFVLPSSVHEVIILREDRKKTLEESRDYLAKMVQDINNKHVYPEEVLSDHAYYYDLETGELS